MSTTSDKISEQNSATSNKSSNHGSACSKNSFTPTINGGEAPFEEFAWTVQEVCKRFWPTAYEDVTITRLDGGSFNRIVALSVKPSLALGPAVPALLPNTQGQDERSEHYVLRVARDSDLQVVDHITVLYYVQKHTSIPVPRVLAFDIGSDNAVERPYTLQQRIPGVCLDTIISKLTFDQRRGLAAQIARIIRQMQGAKNPVAGKIGIPTRVAHNASDEASLELQANGLGELSLDKKLAFMTVTGLPSATDEAPKSFAEADPEISEEDHLQVLHFDLTSRFGNNDQYTGVVNTVRNKRTPVLSFFNFQFVRQMLQELQNFPMDVIDTRLFHQLMQVGLEMDDDLCLGEDTFNLFHGDFEPRNIMVHVCDFGDVHISGVLDWDLSGFVPQAVSCTAPRWVWSVKPGLDSDEREDEEDPTDPEQIALKEAFDDAVGEKFVKMAYSPEHRLVRRLFRLAVGGLVSTESIVEAQSVIKEWAELRPTLKDHDADSDESGDEASDSGRSDASRDEAAKSENEVVPGDEAAGSENEAVSGDISPKNDTSTEL